MMMSIGLLNSLIRIIGDPYLRWKMKSIICSRNTKKGSMSVNTIGDETLNSMVVEKGETDEDLIAKIDMY